RGRRSLRVRQAGCVRGLRVARLPAVVRGLARGGRVLAARPADRRVPGIRSGHVAVVLVRPVTRHAVAGGGRRREGGRRGRRGGGGVPGGGRLRGPPAVRHRVGDAICFRTSGARWREPVRLRRGGRGRRGLDPVAARVGGYGGCFGEPSGAGP